MLNWQVETETFVGSLPAVSRAAVLGPGLSWVAAKVIKTVFGCSDRPEWLPSWCPCGKSELVRGEVDLTESIIREFSLDTRDKQAKYKDRLRRAMDDAAREERAKHRSLPMILLLGQGINAKPAPRPEVNWERIAGQNADFPQVFIQELPTDQQLTSWAEARLALGLTEWQSWSIGLIKLVFWHWSQPVVYAWVFFNYYCKLTSDGQKFTGAVVAAREMVYIVSTLVALWTCPTFLLLDISTVWRDKAKWKRRIAAYILTPHIFVSLCIAQRHPDLRRMFIPLTVFEMLADFASCFALGALLSTDPQTSPLKKRVPLLIGYSLTAGAWLLFFAPVTIVELYKYGKDDASRLATAASGLLSVALAYIVVGAVLLLCGVDVYCNDYTLFFKTECQHGGHCYSGNCECKLGYRGGLCELDDPCSLVGNPSIACCTGPSCGQHWANCAKPHCECDDGWDGVLCGDKRASDSASFDWYTDLQIVIVCVLSLVCLSLCICSGLAPRPSSQVYWD
jgi:hypothetical protein